LEPQSHRTWTLEFLGSGMNQLRDLHGFPSQEI
jgi:hypothetical protein